MKVKIGIILAVILSVVLLVSCGEINPNSNYIKVTSIEFTNNGTAILGTANNETILNNYGGK